MEQHQGQAPPASQSPFHWVNSQGLSLRLQVFLRVRNAEDEIALVRLSEHPDHWWIPAETLQPNEPVEEAITRVSNTWFGTDLNAELSEVKTWPAQEGGEPKWYILHIFEARAEKEDLEKLPDTEEITFFEPGADVPGPFAMGHGDVWPEFGGQDQGA